jgi:divalent metal cation (Fe/Co/Zn/Cd) transporter
MKVATAIGAFTAMRLSAIPPDANHPYGHHQAEYLSAVGAKRLS